MHLIKEYKVYIGGVILLLIGILYYVLSPFSNEEKGENQLAFNALELVRLQEESLQTDSGDKEIMVDVKGAVKNPGVYKGKIGERAIDLIEKAGGLVDGANKNGINFAMKVQDEMVIYVPFEGEEDAFDVMKQDIDDGKVNINTATETELQTLPGIGPAKAQAIIEYRTNQGSFQSIEEIMNISGFGEKTFAKLKDHIKVK